MIISRPAAILIQLCLLLYLLFSGGCASLPSYARPRLYHNQEPLSTKTISYRALTKNDFKAKELPENLTRHKKNLNAHTAASIRPSPHSRYIVSSFQYQDQMIYSGRVEKMSFEAVMFPQKSWWNPTMPKNRETYVLQHEQIHFSLMEIAARQLNQKAEEESATLTIFDADAATTQQRLQKTVQDWIKESQEALLKRHTAFDEDTSLRYNPKRQQWWYNKVSEQLSELARWRQTIRRPHPQEYRGTMKSQP